MVIEKDSVVSLSYQLFSVNDQHNDVLVEERTVDDPLEFLFGQGVLLPKVEEAIKGKSHGFQTQVVLHPRDAFGLHQPDLQTWMDKGRFPQEPALQLGMKFQTQGPDGKVLSVIVKEIEDDKVLIDGNHPLAGIELRFDLRVLRVRQATEEELIRGEVDPRNLH